MLIKPPILRSFTLRHEYATINDSLRILFADIPPSFVPERHVLKQISISTHTVRSLAILPDARIRFRLSGQTDAQLLVQSTIPAPDVNDRETLLTLAKMTNNAYYEQTGKDWYPLDSYIGNDVSGTFVYQC